MAGNKTMGEHIAEWNNILMQAHAVGASGQQKQRGPDALKIVSEYRAFQEKIEAHPEMYGPDAKARWLNTEYETAHTMFSDAKRGIIHPAWKTPPAGGTGETLTQFREALEAQIRATKINLKAKIIVNKPEDIQALSVDIVQLKAGVARVEAAMAQQGEQALLTPAFEQEVQKLVKDTESQPETAQAAAKIVQGLKEEIEKERSASGHPLSNAPARAKQSLKGPQ
jgi:hypothetical protein